MKGQAQQELDDTFQPSPPITDRMRTNYVYAAMIDDSNNNTKGQIYSDLTGRFPVTSSRGNKYLLVVYDYDSNAIIAEPRKHFGHTKSLLNY
jgi:hypothetical protein